MHCAWQAALHPLNSVPSPVSNVGRPCTDVRSGCICSHTGKQARVFSSHVLLRGHWLAYLNDSLWWEKRPPALSLPFSEPLWWRNGAQMWEGLPSGFIQPVQGRLSLFVCLFVFLYSWDCRSVESRRKKIPTLAMSSKSKFISLQLILGVWAGCSGHVGRLCWVTFISLVFLPKPLEASEALCCSISVQWHQVILICSNYLDI